jgi:hypothetical protein
VFHDRRELAALEAIVPRMVLRSARAGPGQRAGGPERRDPVPHGLTACDAVLCVRAPGGTPARRRDGLGLVQGLRRIASQRGICPKLPGPGVDIYYVDNADDGNALRERVLRLVREKGLGN